MLPLINQDIFIIKITYPTPWTLRRNNRRGGISEHPPQHADEAAVIDRVGRHRSDQGIAPFPQQGKSHSDPGKGGNCKKSLGMQGCENHAREQGRGKKTETPTEVAMEGSSEEKFLKDRGESGGEGKTGEADPKISLIDPPHHRMDFGTSRSLIGRALGTEVPPVEHIRHDREHQGEGNPYRRDRKDAEITDASRPDLAPESPPPMETHREPEFAPRYPAQPWPEQGDHHGKPVTRDSERTAEKGGGEP